MFVLTLVYFVLSYVSEFLLFCKEAIFMSARFFITTYVSYGTLGLAVCLVGMHSAADSKWALTNFSYLSIRVGVSDIS